ncbi:MAG: clostripain-related cysteine peptidase [Candidatus Eremiobacteraeota bacterium]|nr:clostripain-related cysteine peptidase [Candidatus Eremiobacteraeota bacterium]
MESIPTTGLMRPAGKERFLEKLREREEEARRLAAVKAEQKPVDTAEISSTASSGRPAVKEGPPEPPQAPEKKEWTVLCYIDGNNDLEPYATFSMLDLEKAGSSREVNVLAELGRISQDRLKEINAQLGRPYEPTGIDGDWAGVRRYEVKKDDPADPGAVRQINSPAVADMKDADMSNPATLSDFLVWGVKKYPAKHYLVVLMDHGGGWLGAFTDDASAGGHHIMTTPQISQAFKELEKQTGVKPDVVDMVACLMGSGEVAHQVKDSMKYLVASEEIGTTDSFEYSPNVEFLQKKVASGEEFTARDLARHLVTYYADRPSAFVTKSAIDLSKMGEVKDAIDGLARALIATDASPAAIKEAINKAQNFSRVYYLEFYSHFRDLYSVAEQLAKSDKIADPKVKEAAGMVMKSVKEAVIEKVSSPYSREEVLDVSQSPDGKEEITLMKVSRGKMEAEGISIYAPTDKKYTDDGATMGRYGALDLARETQWDEFLRKNTMES